MKIFSNKIDDLKEEITVIQNRNREIDKNVSILSDENEKLVSEIADLHIEKENLEKSVLLMREKLENIKIKYNQSATELEEIQKKFSVLKEQMSIFEKLESLAQNIEFADKSSGFVSDFRKADSFISLMKCCNLDKEKISNLEKIVSSQKELESSEIFEMGFDEVCIKNSSISAVANSIF